MSARTTIAIDFIRRRLRGVEAIMRRGSITIERAISIAMPDEIDVNDDRAVGVWIGEQLRTHKINATRAVVAVNRDHAVVRTLVLPTSDLDEVPEMVNLSMKRDLPIDSDDAVIDYIVVGSDESSTEVLACAVPCSIVERVREVSSVAGVAVSRISLRFFGTAALVSSLRESAGRSVLGIDLGEDGFEFVVTRNGRIGFTRGVEVRPGSSGIDETIVTEIRRSWISHRLSEREEDEVAAGFLFAPFDLSNRLERWIGEATGLDITSIRNHPRVRIPKEFPGDAWPLAGLLLREGLHEPTIDFNAPRKAPDLAARKRRRLMLAAGGLLISGLFGWSIGNIQLSRERAVNDDLEGKARSALVEYHRNRRDRLRVEHLESWAGVGNDWMDHLFSFREFAPDPETVVLDGFTGSFVVNPVRYDDDAKNFTVDSEVVIRINGESTDRGTTDRLRTSIVESDEYLLRSTGSETLGGTRLPVPFSFLLRTRGSTIPLPVDDTDDATTEEAGGEG
jgi:hypothetical protein